MGKVQQGRCARYSADVIGQDIVPEKAFYSCLEEWLKTAKGQNYRDDIIVSQFGRIIGWRESVTPIKITSVSTDGPQYLEDIRAVEQEYGFDETYSYSSQMLDYEQYVVFVNETILSMGLSIVAVFFVVIFVTGNFPVTLLVVISIGLVDLFLLALVYYWGLTMNNIVVVQLVIGLGLSVDYAAHISHTYLVVVPHPSMKTKA